MDAFESGFSRRLQDRIGRALQEHADVLVTGRAVTFEEYKAKAAYIEALRDVNQWCEEVRKEMVQGEDTERRVPRGSPARSYT